MISAHRTAHRMRCAGQKDLVRVAPRRATWKCGCGYINVIHFNREINLGHVYPERMRCHACSLAYRGRFIVAPTTTHSENLF